MKRHLSTLNIGVMLTGAILFIVFSLHLWPGLNRDAAMFTTPIISLANGQGWTFHGYLYYLNQNLSGKYNFHTLLYPFVFGLILKANTYEKIAFYSGIINSLTFSCYYLTALASLGESRTKGTLFQAIQISIATGVITLYLQGRPEQLVPLILLFPYLVNKWYNSQSKIMSCYIIATVLTITLLGLLSPMTAIIYLVGVTGWELGHHGRHTLNPRSLRSLSVGLVISAVLVALVFKSCDFSLGEWIKNTITIGSADPTIQLLERITSFSMAGLSFEIPLWNIPILITSILIIGAIIRSNKALKWLKGAIFLCGLSYLVRSAQAYSWVGFVPIILLFALDYSRITRWVGLYARPLSIIYLAYLWIYSILFIRYVLLFLLYIHSGVLFSEAKQEIEKLTKASQSGGSLIAYYWTSMPSFVVMSNKKSPWITAENSLLISGSDAQLSKYEKHTGRTIKYLILPQLSHINAPPPVIYNGVKKYRLIHNRWTERRARIWKIKLGGSMPGYHYALYKLS